MKILCNNGHCPRGYDTPAVVLIRYHNTGSTVPMCDDCYNYNMSMAQEVNDHEMRNFGGYYGVVSWDEEKSLLTIQRRH